MENYNPRQPTRFRFKDSREIEKFKFFTGNFDFEEQELLENVSQDKRYGPIIEVFKEAIRTQRDIGVILYDGPTAQYTYIGFIFRKVGYLYTISTSSILIVNLEYDNQRDKLKVTNTTKDLLVADNVKTLFGQDITGTGDINLYRHELIISTGRTSYDEAEYKLYLTYYSSNKLEANTPEKLTTLTKAKLATVLRGIVLEFANAGVVSAQVSGKYSGVCYAERSGWTLERAIGGSDGTPITSVSDTVTPI